jgi:hypothetical protein
MSASVPHVFLDTNTLLHYRRPDQIDWCAFLGADAVMLVVTPALIDELEAQKAYANRSRKLKDRANASIKWIAQYIECEEPVELRPGVKLLFVRESPMIDFAAHRLSQMVADDQLIASALQFRQETGAHIVFVSNDTGLRLKLQPRGLKGTAPPEDARLPEEMDDAEKEMAELRRELARHQSRRPKLFLTFQDGREFGRIRTIRTKLPKVVKASELVLPAHTLAAHSSESVADYARKLTIWKDEIELLSPCEITDREFGNGRGNGYRHRLYLYQIRKGAKPGRFPEAAETAAFAVRFRCGLLQHSQFTEHHGASSGREAIYQQGRLALIPDTAIGA